MYIYIYIHIYIYIQIYIYIYKQYINFHLLLMFLINVHSECTIMNAACIGHRSLLATNIVQHHAQQTLLLSSAHAGSLHDYVHQLVAQCIRRQRHKPRTAYSEVASTWLNLAEYTVSGTVSSRNK